MPLALPRLHLPMHVPDLDALLGANHDQIVAVHRDLVQFATTDAHDLQALLHVDIPDLQATPVYRQRFGFSTAKNPLPFEASCTWTVLSNDNVTTKFSCGTNSTCEMPRSLNMVISRDARQTSATPAFSVADEERHGIPRCTMGMW
ncbi:hypothetical protein PBRA_005316 [Plasmodiophora brassicae]|uniref:Uncharacterized protein n=1 Tax=Plasmodiophora brassicae TaxID=37360 RepID=A0A0G4IN37_PLABS|nr:hypothetical protein PBRA_005316 [Plasmodiophora brassicae]